MAGTDAYAAIAELLHKSQVRIYQWWGCLASPLRPTQSSGQGGSAAVSCIPEASGLKPRTAIPRVMRRMGVLGSGASCLGWWGLLGGAPAHTQTAVSPPSSPEHFTIMPRTRLMWIVDAQAHASFSPTQPRPFTDCRAPLKAVFICGREPMGFAADGDLCNGEQQNRGREVGREKRGERAPQGLFCLSFSDSESSTAVSSKGRHLGWVGRFCLCLTDLVAGWLDLSFSAPTNACTGPHHHGQWGGSPVYHAGRDCVAMGADAGLTRRGPSSGMERARKGGEGGRVTVFVGL